MILNIYNLSDTHGLGNIEQYFFLKIFTSQSPMFLYKCILSHNIMSRTFFLQQHLYIHKSDWLDRVVTLDKVKQAVDTWANPTYKLGCQIGGSFSPNWGKKLDKKNFLGKRISKNTLKLILGKKTVIFVKYLFEDFFPVSFLSKIILFLIQIFLVLSFLCPDRHENLQFVL